MQAGLENAREEGTSKKQVTINFEKLWQQYEASLKKSNCKKKNFPRVELAKRVYDFGSASNETIFFYKLRRREEFRSTSNDDRYYFFPEGSGDVVKAKETGVIYNPLVKGRNRHTWEINLSWILGIVHKKRSIVLKSKFIKRNIWRNDYNPKCVKDVEQAEFSAFIREIAAAEKAGYTTTINKYGSLILTPPEQSTHRLTLSDIYPHSDDILKTVNTVTYVLINFLKISYGSLYDYADYVTKVCELKNEDKSEVNRQLYNELGNEIYTHAVDFEEILDMKEILPWNSLLTVLDALFLQSQCGFLYDNYHPVSLVHHMYDEFLSKANELDDENRRDIGYNIEARP